MNQIESQRNKSQNGSLEKNIQQIKLQESDESQEKYILLLGDIIQDNCFLDDRNKESQKLINSIQINETKQERTLLSFDVITSLNDDDPSRSEKIFKELLDQDPQFVRNSFEYLVVLQDSYISKVVVVQQRLLPTLNEFNENDEQSENINYLACKSLAMKSKITMKQISAMMEESTKKINKQLNKSDIYTQLCNTYLELKEYQNVIKYYNDRFKIQLTNDECQINSNYCQLQRQELEESILYGELVLNNYLIVLSHLAIAYEELRQIDKAEQAYIKLLENKWIGSVQYSSYVQFLFQYKYTDKQKMLSIFDYLIKGFQAQPTKHNPVISTFYTLLHNSLLFTQIVYSYQQIMSFIQFIEAIRLQTPHILGRICQNIFGSLLTFLNEFYQEQHKEEQYEDNNEHGDLFYENFNEQNQNNVKQKQEFEINGNQNNIKQNMEIEEEEEQSLITIEHEPYLDEMFLKPVKTSQKVSFYSLIHDLVLLKQKENQAVFSLLAYNRFAKEYLHFQKDIQFWDLYYN